jgi:lysophospholipase L1-like esterase
MQLETRVSDQSPGSMQGEGVLPTSIAGGPRSMSIETNARWFRAGFAFSLLACGGASEPIQIAVDSTRDARSPPAADDANDVTTNDVLTADAPRDGAAVVDAPTVRDDDAQLDADLEAAPPLDAGAPAVRLVARVDRSDPSVPRFGWSGSTVLARFTGSSIGVRLGGSPNYFDVRLDGMLRPTLVTTSNQVSYPIASNLASGAHEISIYRRTEARQGDTSFLGFDFGLGGALLPPPPPSDRRLEIVGDSTTCGYGDEGKDANCPFTPATENYDLAYGAVAARAVGAELITIAWSAKGMYRNYAGDRTETMPVLYERTLGDQPSSTWDFTSWIPNAVVINLGSNDFQQGDPGQPFVTTYTEFVRKVRARYPTALIICAVGPKLSGSQLDGARAYVTGIVNAMHAAGNFHVDFLELPQPLPEDGVGCGGHASVAAHQRMADVLAAELRAKLGW